MAAAMKRPRMGKSRVDGLLRPFLPPGEAAAGADRAFLRAIGELTRPPLSLSLRVGEMEGWGPRPGTPVRGTCGSVALALEAQPAPLSPRLIKGDGEVLEEIVTKERHREINKVGVAPSPRAPPPLRW